MKLFCNTKVQDAKRKQEQMQTLLKYFSLPNIVYQYLKDLALSVTREEVR